MAFCRRFSNAVRSLAHPWPSGVFSTLLGVLVTLAACATAEADKPNADAVNASADLGINLAGISYWSSEIVFVDLFKNSQPFKSQRPGAKYGQGGPLDLDADGWIRSFAANGQSADSIIFLRIPRGWPEGIYTCLYDGEGEVQIRSAREIVDQQPGRIRVRIEPEAGQLSLALKKTNPRNPVRNIRFILPGFEDTYQKQPFHPDFLKRWGDFQVLRFMDFQRTNGSPQVNWTDRSRPSMQTQGQPSGVALEHLIQLANTLKADPWFCMPHLATDDYVRQFATMVRRDLHPDAKIYIEYSNECWNGMFPQVRYCRDQGRQLGLSDNDFQAQLRYFSKRSVEVFKIWEDVFGGSQRLVRVLAAQSANPWTSEQVLDFKDAWRHADALAIAPYFGNALGDPKRQEEVARMSVDQVLDACQESICQNEKTIARQSQVAKARGLRLLAYEGGQHLVGHGGAENNKQLEALFHAANRHPRMKGLYLDYLAGWQRNGGSTFVVFSSVGKYSKWGSWGILEYDGQPADEAPKYQAIMELLRASR